MSASGRETNSVVVSGKLVDVVSENKMLVTHLNEFRNSIGQKLMDQEKEAKQQWLNRKHERTSQLYANAVAVVPKANVR